MSIYNNNVCKSMAKRVESCHLSSDTRFCTDPVCPVLKISYSFCFISEAGTRPGNYRSYRMWNKEGTNNPRGQADVNLPQLLVLAPKFSLYLKNWFRTHCCLTCFPIAMIKHHDQATYRRNLCDLCFQRGTMAASSGWVRGTGGGELTS